MMARNITSDQENEDRRERAREREREREREFVCVYLRNVIENLRDFTVAQHNGTCGTCSHKQDDFGQRHLRYNNRSSLSTMMMLPTTTVPWLLLDPLPSAAARKNLLLLLLSPSLSLFWSPALSSLAPSLSTYPKDPSENPGDP